MVVKKGSRGGYFIMKGGQVSFIRRKSSSNNVWVVKQGGVRFTVTVPNGYETNQVKAVSKQI